MKRMILAVAVISTFGVAATAAHARARVDYATVISSTPVMERYAVPREQCWMQPATTYETRRVVHEAPVYAGREHNPAGAVIGALVGGVIGHQFGNSSRGRDHATVAGALVGGLVGNGIASQRGDYQGSRPVVSVDRVPVTREVRRCNMVTDYRERVVGYDVRYAWRGLEYTTRLASAPGRTLRVNVDVHPAGPVRAWGPGPSTPVYVRGH